MLAAITAALLLNACSRGSSPPIHTYSMGEKVAAGQIIYTVYETQWMPQLGEGPAARVPSIDSSWYA